MTKLLIAAVLSAASLPAQAAVAVVSSKGRAASTVEYTMPGTVRYNPEGAANYLVVRGGRGYSIPTGNQASTAVSLVAADEAGLRPMAVDPSIVTLFALRNTGKAEMRGLPGTVYLLDYQDASGARRTVELVLSRDPRARELTDVWRSIDRALSGTGAPVGGLYDQLIANGLGLLRFGERSRVESFLPLMPRAIRFDVPNAPKEVKLFETDLPATDTSSAEVMPSIPLAGAPEESPPRPTVTATTEATQSRAEAAKKLDRMLEDAASAEPGQAGR